MIMRASSLPSLLFTPLVLTSCSLYSSNGGHLLAAAVEVHPDIEQVLILEKYDVVPGGLSWADSYSVGDECYCSMSTFDHGIGTFQVKTKLGWKTVAQICEMLGDGPGHDGRPLYNDVQCGNGPPNDAGDEHTCPGRVDLGPEGCGHVGPEWNLDRLLPRSETRDACRDIIRREDRRPSRGDRLNSLRGEFP